ncbi:MAG: hypothetical protein K9W43_11650 [Candidatus Thorarchaeota archaeon]|nr:hypothetical protein [Candidatus Thorarchaeota archaeon]
MVFDSSVLPWVAHLFLLSFLTSALIDGLRRRDYFHFHHELTKFDRSLLAVLFGFNIIIVGPIFLVYTWFNPVLGPYATLVETLLRISNIISSIIPLLISGAFSYLILSILWETYGVSISLSSVTIVFGLLLYIELIGWLQPVIPFIVESITTLLTQLFAILFGLMLLVFVSEKCITQDEATKGKNESQSHQTGEPSLSNAFWLCINLGRRVVLENHEDSLRLLRQSYLFNDLTKNLLGQAGNVIGFDFKDLIHDHDLLMAQDILKPVTGQFGMLSKNLHDRTTIFKIIILGSLLALGVSIHLRFFFGYLFVIPVVILAVIIYALESESSQFGVNRYGRPGIPQYHSFMLFDDEFRRRVIRDRFLFVMNIVVLGAMVVLAATGQISYFWGAIALGTIAVAFYLVRHDHTIRAVRLSFDTAFERSIQFLGLKRDKEQSVESMEVDVSLPEEETIVSPSQDSEVSEDWQQLLRAKGHDDFVDRVESNASDVYGDMKKRSMPLALGFTTVIFGSMLFLMPFPLNGLSMFLLIYSYAALIIGIPALLYGVYNSVIEFQNYRFHGLSRRNLGNVLGFLDLREIGDTEIGRVSDPYVPYEIRALMINRIQSIMVLRTAIIHLGNLVTWPKSLLDRVWKSRSSYPKLELVGVFIVSMLLIVIHNDFSVLDSDIFPISPKLLFELLIGFLFVLAILSIVFYYHDKRRLADILQEPSRHDSTNQDTLIELIRLLKSQFPFPLRIYVINSYPEVVYTGRSFVTTEGVEFREAIIIPQGSL